MSPGHFNRDVEEGLRATQRIVLDALLEFDPAAVSFDELARYLAPGIDRIALQDALAELRSFRLVHVIATVERHGEGRPHAPEDEFVLVSRAAARASDVRG
jgi:hypothetical protein